MGSINANETNGRHITIRLKIKYRDFISFDEKKNETFDFLSNICLCNLEIVKSQSYENHFNQINKSNECRNHPVHI